MILHHICLEAEFGLVVKPKSYQRTIILCTNKPSLVELVVFCLLHPHARLRIRMEIHHV